MTPATARDALGILLDASALAALAVGIACGAIGTIALLILLGLRR